ncbi:response regulator mprA [Actinoplanes sp. SE50]|uniref:response regulator n=1 Tax=unclassified Actinoplanes TaxID=2626549 RepID=UPI00023EBE2D|nr:MULTISPECIES: response regulator [unclassified Actinoplanes]AEV88088.1 Response regulator mprA [Actinoplanes sp. SE50/110]ATO86492.1 response regulator mprA [Actinoplanes sp. SE50]SLM03908.1 two-component system response regulator [Actinoplanes sp. SE50/110]
MSHRILLVEDEELNRMLVKAVLSRAGVDAVRDAELVDATTLTEARARVHDTELDLILLDLNLPDGNGLTLARELKSAPPADRPKPVVVAVTASVLPQDQKAALDAGCDDFLDKPYAAADLVATVARNLRL